MPQPAVKSNRKLRNIWLGAAGAILALVITAALIACSGSSKGVGNYTAVASTAVISTPVVSTSAGSTATQTPHTFAGYGSLDADWSALHKQDATKNPGAAYDKQSDGTDRFALVHHTSGRITGFTMQYDSGIAIATAQEVIREQMPPDATVLLNRVASGSLASPQCQLVEYQSATLASAFSDPKIGDPQGYVDVVFSTSNRASGDATYDPQHVDTISVSVGDGPDQLSSASC